MKSRSTGAIADHELIARVAQGEVPAFEQLYDRHSAQAFSLALRITGRRVAAEEVTQDAFMGLWRAAPSFQPGRGSLQAWLLAMVRHRAIDLLRRSVRHQRDVTIDEPIAARLVAPEQTGEQVLDRETARETRELLTGLPSEQRQVIELAFFAGMSQIEISARTGSPLGTVKGRQRLALQKMHRALTGLRQPAPVSAADGA
jgi:RNA polymerase sigma-70 factor, ECF subfamily